MFCRARQTWRGCPPPEHEKRPISLAHATDVCFGRFGPKTVHSNSTGDYGDQRGPPLARANVRLPDPAFM